MINQDSNISKGDAMAQNQKFWDEVASVHYDSYNLAPLRAGKSLIDIRQQSELYPIKDKTLLHLQCHIGSDTLSLALDGATVTGVDFSEDSLKFARQLRDELGLEARFIHSNVYDIKEKLDEQFDIVYTSQGVLCWLNDLNKWAKIISDSLKPDGTFFIQESHPAAMMLEEDKDNKRLDIKYTYFNNPYPYKWDDDWPDYANPDYIAKNHTFEWHWSLSEIMTALLDNGLEIVSFKEYPSIFYQMFSFLEKDDKGWYHLPKGHPPIPLVFSLKCRKRIQ